MNALRLMGRQRVYCAFDDNDNILRGCVMMRSGGAARAAAEHCELLCAAVRDCTIVYGVRLEKHGKKHGRQGESVERCSIQQVLIHAGSRTRARACAGWGQQLRNFKRVRELCCIQGFVLLLGAGCSVGWGFAPGAHSSSVVCCARAVRFNG